MPEVTTQQILHTHDDTQLVVDSWLKDEDTMIMQPGDTNFTGRCPVHGVIETGYVAMLVGWAVSDHAKQFHGGLMNTADLLDVGPSIKL